MPTNCCFICLKKHNCGNVHISRNQYTLEIDTKAQYQGSRLRGAQANLGARLNLRVYVILISLAVVHVALDGDFFLPARLVYVAD